jgi:hypothetical protein
MLLIKMTFILIKMGSAPVAQIGRAPGYELGFCGGSNPSRGFTLITIGVTMIEHISFKITSEMQEISNKVIQTQKEKWDCVMCFKKTIGRGVYAPQENQRSRFGLKDKETAIIYAICSDHTQQNTKVEDIVNALAIQ